MAAEHDGLPTIHQVAQLAGVSTATVSRTLNDPEKVTAVTRERVLEAVRALDYVPDVGAQSLARGRRRSS